MKRRIIILSLCAAIVLYFVLSSIVKNNQPIVFHDSLILDKVGPMHRELAHDIFDANSGVITKVHVSEASRSHQVIRWVFISDRRLNPQEEQPILSSLFDYMLSPNEPLFPLEWEVYFCSDETVNSAYISRYGHSRIFSERSSFTDWEQVPGVGDKISFKVITEIMMESWRWPIYGPDPRPITEMTPDIPKG